MSAAKDYITALLTPGMDASQVLSNTELYYIAASMSSAEANELKAWMNDKQLQISKEIYKYNINVSGPNEFLEDVRNYHNFRSQFDEYPATSPTIAGKPDMFGAGNTRAGTAPSKSYYMSAGDFFFSEKISINTTNNVHRAVPVDPSYIQPIILNEFQPDATIFNSRLMTTGLESVLNIARNIPGVGKVMEVVDGLLQHPVTQEIGQNVGLRIANRILAEVSLNPESLYGLSAIRNGGRSNVKKSNTFYTNNV